MSTDVQLKGDSLRRQMEQSAQYAEKNGLELAEDSQLKDIGISAFKGANARGGALGSFLAAIKAGNVASGSFLIIESLDRLSRQEVLPALSLFVEILNAGVNIVTLSDGRVYTLQTQMPELMYSLLIMSMRVNGDAGLLIAR